MLLLDSWSTKHPTSRSIMQ